MKEPTSVSDADDQVKGLCISIRNLKEATISLCRLVQGLQDELVRLQTENAELRRSLGLAVKTVAPGEGVDEWRDTNR